MIYDIISFYCFILLVNSKDENEQIRNENRAEIVFKSET